MSLNTYVTTTDLYKPKHDHRRIIQDMCISALLTSNVAELFTLKQIITPEWCNPGKKREYKGVPVQNVETRDLTNYDPKCIQHTRRTCPVINHSRVRSETNDADNEHLSLFENMEVETPCIVIDGDILLYYNGRLRALHNLLIGSVPGFKKPDACSICASHAVFLRYPEDQQKDIISMKSHLNFSPIIELIRDNFFRSATHLSRSMSESMTTYKIINTKP